MQLKRAGSGFSLLELVISLFIIALLMAFAYQRLERMAEDVERVSFEGALNKIQAQITLKTAEWYAVGKPQKRVKLEQINPMSLVETKPDNYGGELKFEELADKPGQYWYFVTDRSWLAYKVLRNENLKNNFKQQALIPYRLRVSFAGRDQDQGLVLDLRLESVQSFKWQLD